MGSRIPLTGGFVLTVYKAHFDLMLVRRKRRPTSTMAFPDESTLFLACCVFNSIPVPCMEAVHAEMQTASPQTRCARYFRGGLRLPRAFITTADELGNCGIGWGHLLISLLLGYLRS